VELRDRLRKLTKAAEDAAVVVRLRDSGARYFEEMEVFKQLFLAQMDLFKGVVPDSPVLDAVRGATPESRRAFEERFGPITLEARIIGSDGVEVHTLTETGEVQAVRHEGEEAERIRTEARRSYSGRGKHA